MTVALTPAAVVGPRQSTPQSGGVATPEPAGTLPTGYREPLAPQPDEFGVPGPVALTVKEFVAAS